MKSRHAYNLGSFVIKLEIDKLEEEGDIREKYLPLMMHEYFHYYLQFHSLFFLEGFVGFCELIKVLHNQGDNKNFPLETEDNFNNIPELRKYLDWEKKILIKIDEESEDVYKKIKIKDFKKSNRKVGNSEFYDVIVENKNHPDKTVALVSELMLNESMAYFAENAINTQIKLNSDLANNLDIPNDFPYRFLEKIMTRYDIAAPVIFLVAFISMQYPNPGIYFVDTLMSDIKILKAMSVDITSLENFKNHKYFIEKLSDPKLVFYLNRLKENVLKHKSELNLPKQFDWILEKYLSIIDLLENKKIPDIIEIFFNNKFNVVSYKDKINKLMSKFPSPIIVDDENEFKIIGNMNENQIDEYISNNRFFISFDYIFKLIRQKNKINGCPLFNYCSHSSKDSNCKINPWTKGLNENPCEVGQIAKYLNIETYEEKPSIPQIL